MKLIPLSNKHKNNKNKGKYFAQVDDMDCDWIMQWNWSLRKTTKGKLYASFYDNKTGKNIKLHRFIMTITDPKIQIDHKDNDGLNCQRSNLRVATNQQNSWNKKSHKGSTSAFKGVWWNDKRKRWISVIKKNGKRIFIGRFKNEEDAARAYDTVAKDFQGDFCSFNLE